MHLSDGSYYVCQYHTGDASGTTPSSIEDTLDSIDHSGASSIYHGDGYNRLEISNATLAIQTSSSPVTLLELDLLQYYVDPEGGTTTAATRANRYLRLTYVGSSVSTTI